MAAGLTDFLDGYLARKLGRTTALGAMLDQIADKIFITGALVCMVGVGLLQGIMIIPVLIILAREFAVSGLREYAAQHVRPLPVDALGKVKTLVQFFSIALILLPTSGVDWGVWIKHLGAGLLWLAAMLAVLSGVRYAFISFNTKG